MSKIRITKNKSGLCLDVPAGISIITLKDWKRRNNDFIEDFKANSLHNEWTELPVYDDGLNRTFLGGKEVENV